jgi:hypothetical protein
MQKGRLVMRLFQLIHQWRTNQLETSGPARRRGQPGGIVVTLSEEQVDYYTKLVRDQWACISERVLRFATPEERVDAASRINPETALFFSTHVQILDPYGDIPPEDFPDHCDDIGRETFAVDPDEGIAVWMPDLPEATLDALRSRECAADADSSAE